MGDEQTNEMILFDKPTEIVVTEGSEMASGQQKRLWVALASTLGGKFLEELASQALDTGPNSQSQLMLDANVRYITDQIEEMALALKRLEDKGVELYPADVQNTMFALHNISCNTNGKKRKYLTNAMKKTFSLRMYEQGNLNRFTGYLQSLEYGELYLLELVANKDTVQMNGEGMSLPAMLKAHIEHHGKQLTDIGLFIKHTSTHWRVSSMAPEFVWFITADDDDLEEDP